MERQANYGYTVRWNAHASRHEIYLEIGLCPTRVPTDSFVSFLKRLFRSIVWTFYHMSRKERQEITCALMVSICKYFKGNQLFFQELPWTCSIPLKDP